MERLGGDEATASFSSTTVVLDHPTLQTSQSLNKKKSTSKKPKPKVKKVSFEECLAEVGEVK